MTSVVTTFSPSTSCRNLFSDRDWSSIKILWEPEVDSHIRHHCSILELELDAIDELRILNQLCWYLNTNRQGALTRLALQCPSQFIIKDDYHKIIFWYLCELTLYLKSGEVNLRWIKPQLFGLLVDRICMYIYMHD